MSLIQHPDPYVRAEALEAENAKLREALETNLDAILTVKRTFGAPGDWGYQHREGQALYELYKALAEAVSVLRGGKAE